MGHLTHSLGSILKDLHLGHEHGDPQRPRAHQQQDHGPSAAPQEPQNPSEQEIRTYLDSLARAYDLPTDFVHAVAKTENHFHQADHVNPAHKDKHGRLAPGTIDYGLMQINSSKIGEPVKDPHGEKFKIGRDIKTDWKANARAGVAILAGQYELAKLEQGPVTSGQDRAQQAYLGYNGGSGNRDRYLHERRDGKPHDLQDRKFLENYLGEKRKR
jgi:hypothetical protein